MLFALVMGGWSLSARAEDVSVVGVSYGPSANGRRVVVSVTLQNNTEYRIKGKVYVAVELPGRVRTKRKSVRLEPRSRVTVLPSAIPLSRTPYASVADVSASFVVSKIYAPSPGSMTGEWNGTYTHPYYGNSGVHATIVQQGSSISLSTYFRGVGHFMSGKKSSSRIRVVDVDGQTWTSLGPVSAHAFLLRDYLLEYPDRHPPLEQDLRLGR
jgi:hypothetical protein